MLKAGENRTLFVVAAALTDADGRVLMQRRPDDKQHGGLWEFPGGKVEAGETPEAALVRELYEELGIKVEAESLVPLSFSSVPGLVMLLYRCSAWRGVPVATDGAKVEWVAPEDLHQLPMPPADVPLIAALQAPSRS